MLFDFFVYPNYPPPPNSNRNPVSALYKIRTHSTPSKGAFFPSKQCKIAVHSAPHQLSVRGWCGDYNANFSIVGRVVLLQGGVAFVNDACTSTCFNAGCNTANGIERFNTRTRCQNKKTPGKLGPLVSRVCQ